jgi:hypothetical protein
MVITVTRKTKEEKRYSILWLLQTAASSLIPVGAT